MSSESRVIRPFRTADRTQNWIEENISIELRTGDSLHQKITPGGTSRIVARSLTSCTPFLVGLSSDLYGAFLDDLNEIGGYEEDSFRLLVVIKSAYLKRVSVIKEFAMSEIQDLGASIELHDELFGCIHHGWELSVVLVLHESQMPKAGIAWRRGTWMARADFLVASPTEGLGFTPRALTDELRKKFELSEKSTRYVQVIDGMSILDGATVDQVIEYYVDEGLLRNLSSSPSSPFSVLEQSRIFLDAASFIVTEACRDEEFKEKNVDDLKDSVVHKFLVLLAGDNTTTQQDWLDIWQRSPAKVIAQIESHADMAQKIEKVMAALI